MILKSPVEVSPKISFKLERESISLKQALQITENSYANEIKMPVISKAQSSQNLS